MEDLNIIKEDDNRNIHQLIKKNKLAIYSHHACTLHNIPDHPEQPNRILSIIKYLKTNLNDDKLEFREAPQASLELIKLFHTEQTLKRFLDTWKFTYESYHIRKQIFYQALDGGDTKVMYTTKEAAMRAIGSVVAAIDAIYAPKDDQHQIDTAFCCIRPPGHHAEPNKSCGFCFFNNVGIGAKYLQTKHGVQKVAVLDFDVHHGNGIYIVLILIE
jgi:acetoin utilization deacetylase AcuC-like enzyme